MSNQIQMKNARVDPTLRIKCRNIGTEMKLKGKALETRPGKREK
jgi:hypothetical protein